MTDPSPDTTTEFEFTPSGGNIDTTPFNLKDGGEKQFDGLHADTYHFTETDPGPGYVLASASCEQQNPERPARPSVPVAPSATVDVTVAAGETWICTFTNALAGSSATDKIITASNQDFTTEPGITISPFSDLQDVAIGEIVTYQVTVDLPYGNYGPAMLVDTMDKGLAFVDCTSITGVNTTPSDFSAACANPVFQPQPTPPLPDSVDYKRIVEFDVAGALKSAPVGATPAPTPTVGILEVGPGGGTITFTYRAVVLDNPENVGVPPVPYPTKLANSAVFQYYPVIVGVAAPESGPLAPLEIGPASVSVEVVEPQLQITKEADTEFVSGGLNGTIVNFTVTIQHTPNSHTPAFDVVLTDPIPSQFDLVSPIDCSGSTNDPDAPLPIDLADVITAGWSEFDLGDVGVCTFQLQANDTWSVGENVTNVAYVKWTSLPGVPDAGADCPADTGKQNCGDYSTERFYDPNDPAGANNYIASSDTAFVSPGGKEDQDQKGRNFQLPGTGFAPGVYTELGPKPAVAYNDSLGVNLRIPKLNLDMAIDGVPYANDVWQADWLTGVGGWLEGTAFPGLDGNSVIMSHVETHYGSPGPFARLNALSVGDNIFITAFGRLYIYQVTKMGNVAPDDISVLKHSDKPVLTLITCSKWNAVTQTYDGRFVVQTKLVQVNPVGAYGR